MFRSKKQRRLFYALKSKGEMDQETIDEWESDTPKNIPETVTKKAGFFKKALVKEALRRDTVWRAINNRLKRSYGGDKAPQLAEGKGGSLSTGEWVKKEYGNLFGAEPAARSKALDKIHALNKSTKYRRKGIDGVVSTVPKMFKKKDLLKVVSDYEKGSKVRPAVKAYWRSIKTGEVKLASKQEDKSTKLIDGMTTREWAKYYANIIRDAVRKDRAHARQRKIQ